MLLSSSVWRGNARWWFAGGLLAGGMACASVALPGVAAAAASPALADLIAELLELSRIKTRRLKLEPVDLGVLLGEVADVFEHDLRGKGVAFVVDTPMPRLNCERARLRQVGRRSSCGGGLRR